MGGDPLLVCGPPLSRILGGRFKICEIPILEWNDSIPAVGQALEALAPTLMLSIERPGVAASGRYTNMHGEDLFTLFEPVTILMIEKSAFGSIQIDGRTYTTDVLIYPDGRVTDNWWRRQGHRLALEDLEALLAAEPDVIVIGAGVYGRVQPEPGLEKALQQRGVELVMDPTGEAIAHFNELTPRRRTAAGFHLTC